MSGAKKKWKEGGRLEADEETVLSVLCGGGEEGFEHAGGT